MTSFVRMMVLRMTGGFARGGRAARTGGGWRVGNGVLLVDFSVWTRCAGGARRAQRAGGAGRVGVFLGWGGVH